MAILLLDLVQLRELLCLSGIGAHRKGVSPFVTPSGHLSVHPHVFLHDGWLNFLHIGYHDQVSWSADACKREFGSVPNFINYDYFFIKFECLL